MAAFKPGTSPPPVRTPMWWMAKDSFPGSIFSCGFLGHDEDRPVRALEDLKGDVVFCGDGAPGRPVTADDHKIVVAFPRFGEDPEERRRSGADASFGVNVEGRERRDPLLEVPGDPGRGRFGTARDVE